MFSIALSVFLMHVTAGLEGLVVVSTHTPSSLVQELQLAASADADISFVYYSAGLFQLELPPSVVFDFTFAAVPAFYLRLAAESFKFLLFLPYPPKGPSTNPRVFYLHPPAQTEADALSALLRDLDWQPVHLMSSSQAESETLASSIRDLAMDSVIVVDHGAEKIYQSFVGKTVKPSGNWRIVSTHSAQGAQKVLDSIEQHRIDRERGAWLFSSRSMWSGFGTGAVVLVEKGLNSAESEGHYEYLAMRRALDTIQAIYTSQSPKINRDTLLEQVSEALSDRIVSEEYLIVNYDENEVQKEVGQVVGTSVTWSGGLVYPGNVTELNTSAPTLRVSGNLAPVNADGSFSLLGYVSYIGVFAMLGLVNADESLLENFVLEVFATDCGIDLAIHDVAYSCFEDYVDELGLFYLDGFIDDSLETNISVMQELGVDIPHIAGKTFSSEFHDSNNYEKVIVITPHDFYKFSVSPSILKGFGWQNLIVFFMEGYHDDLAPGFLTAASQQGLKILNSAEHQFLTFSSDYETFLAANREHFEHALTTNGKIIFAPFDCPTCYLLPEALYDVGARSGDFMIFGFSRLSSIIPFVSEESAKKVVEVGDGSLSLVFGEYIGDYGQELQASIAEAIAPDSTAWTCYQIETFMLGVHTLDMMITLGRDYEDPQILNEYIRMQHYTGCTGTVSIDGEGNGRSQFSYQIHNFYKDEDSWGETQVGTYTMGTTVPLKYTEPIVWPLGSTEVPEDMVQTDFECGFDLSTAHESQASIVLSRVLFGGVLTIALLASIGVYTQSELSEPKEITEAQPMMFEDAMVLALPVVETLQVVALGPSVWNINPYLAMLCSAVIVDFQYVRVMKDWTYAYYAACTISGVCVLCYLLLIIGKRCKLPNTLNDITETVCLRQYHICWQIVFMTVLSVLASALKCDASVTEEFQDSFLDVDCTINCWSGTHLGYAVASSCLILLYVMLACILRRVAENYVRYSSVKTQNLYSLTSIVFKGCIVCVSFGLKTFDWFPYVYSVLICLWTIYSFVTVPYNYPRLCHWQRMLNLGIALHQPLYLLELHRGPGIELPILHACICVGIGVAGIVFQVKKYPSLLKRKPARDIAKLFRFQLGNQVAASELSQHQLDYMYRIPDSRHGDSGRQAAQENSQ